MSLEGGALMQDDFVAFSKDYVLFAHVTTRVATDKHQNLLTEKGGQGFPYIVFMDAEGGVIAKHQAARNAQAFAQTGGKAKSFLELKAKADKGDKSAKIEYTLRCLEMGSLKVADAEAELKKLGKLSETDQARFDAARADAAVKEVLQGISSKEEAEAAQQTFYGWFKEGRPFPSGGQEISYYCQMILAASEKNKDAESFEKALGKLRELFGSNPRAAQFFKAQEDRLKALKSTGEKKEK